MKRLVIEFLESRFVAFAFRTVFYLLSLFSFILTCWQNFSTSNLINFNSAKECCI